jgi:LacI family transcriptional regulator
METYDGKKTRVTLLDVAKHAQVSRATASLVIRKSPLVGSETRAKVEETMRELGYVYNVGAARLRAERSYIVGVIVPNLTNPFFAELLSGIESVIDAADMIGRTLY